MEARGLYLICQGKKREGPKKVRMTINRYEGESRFCIQVFERETNGADAREGNLDSRLGEEIRFCIQVFERATNVGGMRKKAVQAPG